MEGPNSRVDQFIREHLEQIDISLSPEERRAASELAPYLRWGTDEEILELIYLRLRKKCGKITDEELARAEVICGQIAARLVKGGSALSVLGLS